MSNPDGSINSANMGMPVPAVGVTAGDAYASDINACLSIIDVHTHASGSGVQITPSGMNINALLPMANNIVSNAQAINFATQTSNAANQSLFFKGVDLYCTDGSGNVIRVTASGSVSGSAGTITGLPSGTASAAFATATFTFQSATSTAANIDGGNYYFRNLSPNSTYAVELSAPNALASNYQLFLPAIPAQTNVMTLDTSGNMGSTTYDAIGQAMTATGANAIGVTMTLTGANAIAASRTRAAGSSVAIGGVAKSSSCGVFATSSTSYVNVTNLAVTIVTSGRPVSLAIVSNGSSSARLYCTTNAFMIIARTGTSSATVFDTTTTTTSPIPPPGTVAIDSVAAGTYTYTVQMKSTAATPANLEYCILVAYEL